MGLDLDLVDLLVLDRDVLALVDLVALDDVLALDLLAGQFVDHALAEAIAGLAIELVQADAAALGRCRRHRHRAGDKGKLRNPRQSAAMSKPLMVNAEAETIA